MSSEIDIFKEIKERVGIRQIVEQYYGPVNHNRKAICPFHQEKTPSFSVLEKENMFKCFGCGVGGDGIKFVEMFEQLPALDAAKLIDSDFHLGLFDKQDFKPTKKTIQKKVEKSMPKIEETI